MKYNNIMEALESGNKVIKAGSQNNQWIQKCNDKNEYFFRDFELDKYISLDDFITVYSMTADDLFCEWHDYEEPKETEIKFDVPNTIINITVNVDGSTNSEEISDIILKRLKVNINKLI